MLKKIKYHCMSTRRLLVEREFLLMQIEELSSWPLIVYIHTAPFVKATVNIHMRELQQYIIPELAKRGLIK